MIINILFIILGLILLVIGADLLVRGASNIAKRFHIPEILVGLSIVAIGTSMPELIITVNSAKSSAIDLIIGNSIGSDLCNLLFILGTMALIKPITITKETKNLHIPVAFASTVIILCMCFGLFGSEPGVINNIDGIFLITLFLLYLAYPIIIEIKDIVETYKENKKNHIKPDKKTNMFLSVALIIIGCVLLKYGGDFVVNNSINIAEIYNISQRVIGLTIIALGTALPEFITSIVSIVTKNTDLAVGNLIGSSVLNSFLILGLGSLITPLSISQEFNKNLILLTLSTLMIWLFMYIPKKSTLTRWKGIILVFIFFLYIFLLFR
ncbi:MAG: calcium/sodium antiporter [Clostridia bacterium]|nr:calcium/sodium antiporter [Clostridia bacterium]